MDVMTRGNLQGLIDMIKREEFISRSRKGRLIEEVIRLFVKKPDNVYKNIEEKTNA
jgi:hypothetical protein